MNRKAESRSEEPLILLCSTRRVERVWPAFDAFLYNTMVINVVIGFSIPFLAACMMFPNGSWILATALSALFCAAEAVVYAFLASTMPRSGGEYYFQSRILSGSFGSVSCFAALVLGGAMWVAITGWYAAYLAIGPLFVVLASLTGSEFLLSVGRWCQSSWGVFFLSILVIAWSALVNILGLRRYAVLQRISWAIAAAMLAVVVVALMTISALPQLPVYQTAMATAGALGFSSGHSSSWLVQSLWIVPLASFTLVYSGWSTQQAGETKRAGELRVQLFVILGSLVSTAALSIVVGGLVMDRFGPAVLGASAFLFFEHPDAMPLPTIPFFWFVADTGRLGGLVAVFLVVLFNSFFWIYAPNSTLAASRVLLAMSSDRILPRWFGALRSTTRAPTHAIVAFSLLSLAPSAIYAFTSYWRLTMTTVAVVNTIAFAITCMAGALFPFVRRELYRGSTAARYDVFGIPLITLCGAVFVGFTGWLIWRFAVDPTLSLGLGLLIPMGASLALYAASLAVYVISGALRRSREGIELEVWFTDISSSSSAS